MAQIRSIGIFQAAKFMGVLYAAGTAIIAIPVAIVGVIYAAASGKPEAYAMLLFVVAPVFYGALGFVSAGLGAWIYNQLAARIGGIEIDIG